MKANKLPSMGLSKVNQSIGLTLQKNYLTLTGRILRGYTLLIATLEVSNSFQASERHRNAILQHIIIILVD